MTEEVSQVLVLIIDRGETMADETTKSYEKQCMKIFFDQLQKTHLDCVYFLYTFDQTPRKIGGEFKKISELENSYNAIRNNYEFIRNENTTATGRAKYRKCFDAIKFCANELIRYNNENLQSPFQKAAMLRLLVLTDGTIDQSDAIFVSQIANLLVQNKIYLDFAIINGWIPTVVYNLSEWSGGSVYQMLTKEDVDAVYQNPAFYDPRIRMLKPPEVFKITSKMVLESDQKEIRALKPVPIDFNRQGEIQNDPWLNDNLKKAKEIENKVIQISNDIKQKIESAPNATLILLAGSTGNGKSTLMSCLSGKPMEVIKSHNRLLLNIANMPLDHPDNPIGHGGNSKTRTVEIVHVPSLNIIFVDCPGYFDSAGPDQNLINSIAINQVFNINPSLRMKMKVLVFISTDDIHQQRMARVVDSLNMAYALIPDVEVLKQGVEIVITKGLKQQQKLNISKFHSMGTSESTGIQNSTWKMVDFINYVSQNSHVWNFPSPYDFKTGLFNNFPDAKPMTQFMVSDPIINPPHRIPLDNSTYSMILELITTLGNCQTLVNDLFNKIELEFVQNALNLPALRCWRITIMKLSKIRFQSLSEFAGHIEQLLPLPHKYKYYDIFKSMNLLAIFQSFIVTAQPHQDKQDLFNSLNNLKEDFFCEKDITLRIEDSLKRLNTYIKAAEIEEENLVKIRKDFEAQEAEHIKELIKLEERAQELKDAQESFTLKIEQEKVRLNQRRMDLDAYKQQVNRQHTQNLEAIRSEHSQMISQAQQKLNCLLNQLRQQRLENQRLKSNGVY